MQIEKYIPYIIIGGVGLGIIYFLATRTPSQEQQPLETEIPVGPAAMPGVIKTGIQGQLLAMASKQLGIPSSELVVRSLRPQDLGLTDWNVTAAGAGWVTMANTTVADNTFISFDGCSYGGTNFSQLRITAGARTAEYWMLDWIAGLESQVFYDTTPTIAQQNQPVIIDVYAKGAGTESINIMGTVVERRGMVVA
ncbi:MAG: hypothetical protein ACTSUF_03725 [Candidatus Heimdallarchaeaceae archaeon]